MTCEQFVELLPIWGGGNCMSTHDEVARLIEDKKVEIAARITCCVRRGHRASSRWRD